MKKSSQIISRPKPYRPGMTMEDLLCQILNVSPETIEQEALKAGFNLQREKAS